MYMLTFYMSGCMCGNLFSLLARISAHLSEDEFVVIGNVAKLNPAHDPNLFMPPKFYLRHSFFFCCCLWAIYQAGV